MARYTGPVCKLCRREGEKLFLKGERCYTDKCPVVRRNYPPGQHGQGRKKISEYGVQLRTKQRARRYYGVLEKQFRHYYDLAARQQGVTGENLLRLLESRLDNVVYRLNWASSRPEARQLVIHGHYTVNGRRVNIPSYRVKPGDVVAIAKKSMDSPKIKALTEASGRPIPQWLDANKDTYEAKIIALPTRDQIDLDIAETLIVELYSK